MNRVFINFVDMLKATLQYYVENPQLLIDNPALEESVGKIRRFVAQINALDSAQAEDKEGTLHLKAETRAALSLNMLRVCSAVRAYATTIADVALKMSVDYTESELSHMRDHVLLQEARAVYEIALPLKDKLATWKVTPDDVDAINTTSVAFEAKDPAIKNINSRTRQATDDLKAKKAEVTAYLKDTLDVYMEPLKYSDPTAYGQYTKARTIIKIAAGRTKKKSKKDATDTSSAAEAK